MRKFKFSLERLLQHRVHLEQKKEREFVKLKNSEDFLKKELHNLQHLQNSGLQFCSQKIKGEELDLIWINRSHEFKVQSQIKMENLKIQIQSHHEQTEITKKDWHRAIVERKKLESLKENEKLLFKKQRRKIEAKQFDEWNQTFGGQKK